MPEKSASPVSLLSRLYHIGLLIKKKQSPDDKKRKLSIVKFLLGMVAYGILPTDLIPDIIPIVGLLDDSIVAIVLILFSLYKIKQLISEE